MNQYFSDDTYNYSVPMMHAYTNLFKPKQTRLRIDDLKFNLEYNSWADGVRPIDVLNDIRNKKYKNEASRIKNADTKYPIIVDSNYNILDGVHRFVRHIIDNKKTINVHIFDKKTLKKFVTGKRNEPNNISINAQIETFFQRFKCAGV